jgi:nucleoredoxin
MKKSNIAFLAAALLTCPVFADFQMWTNKDGRQAELEFVKTTEKDGQPAGEFRMRNGKSITIKAADLDDAGQKKLAENQTTAAKSQDAATAHSVFDKILDGNLVKLEGKSLKRADVTMPSKYYAFYYSASWCGPCHQFTPSLVEFYNKTKPGNDKFEIFLVTCDQEEKAMEGYVKEMKMPWPVIKLAKAQKFQKEFKHDVKGIPEIVVCDPKGTIIIKTTDTNALGKMFAQ